ncbi:F0F1 ATP synthase subunit B [Phyllobacterium leguminum]|uniref:ATP synthase subunit b n=1 Tax=Phyllobacterium leguminum TaxID=314237 RepID=A0A318T7L2_9HYPH|nr:F0F1 ATP synthase subunit B [Phyllobacterium leguminum]PYE90553.1 F-type H+-transporting ATPase subunit b [Phyllobacterium leguminum]
MDATFWAFIALVIFIGIVVYMKVPGMLARSLDERAERIGKELDDARRLREEAQALLAEYQQKRREAEKEAADILTAAEREAALLLQDAKQKMDDYVVRRNKLAEQKIAQAETEAVNAVRSSAVDIAVAAAGKLIAGKLDPKTANELFKKSVDEVGSRLN